MSAHDLRLFGVLHPDRAGKVTAELDDYARDADVIFIEHPLEPFGLRPFARLLVRTPALFVGMVLYSFVLYHLLLPLTGTLQGAEVSAVRSVADERRLPIHEVDDHPIEMVADAGPWWMASNWAITLLFLGLFPAVTLGTIGVLAGVVAATRLVAAVDRRAALLLALPLVWAGGYLLLFSGVFEGLPVGLLLLGGMLSFRFTVVRTLGSRNEHMLDRIEEIVEREGYETGCLVTGKAHLSGIIEAAEDRDLHVSRSRVSKWLRRSDHEVEDPDPDSGDWADRVGGRSSATIESEPGSEDDVVGARIAARLIDAVVFVLLVPVGAVAAGVVTGLALGDGAIETGLWLGAIGVPLLYTPLAEIRYGRTLGKRLLGLVVTGEDGAPCTTRAAVVRNLLRPFDLLLFYGVGLVVMLATDRRQRLGDLAADTVVVRAVASDGRTRQS